MQETERARALVARMTPEEKAALLRGKDYWHSEAVMRLGVPSITLTDGPHGLRKQAGEGGGQLGEAENLPATCFPTASATACSFDRALLQEIGAAMGEECRQEEVAVILGPGLNIKRSPLCGRNFEYFSEDPVLAGELAAAMVRGIQSQNVGASIKHFAANNQETRRMVAESVVDERALREIYLQGFEIAVKKGEPWTVMCSYNRLKGAYASENRFLLTELLREEWGYKGLVVSDWGAVNDRVAAVKAGLDLEMPFGGKESDRAVLEALDSGALSQEALDACATRVVELILRSGARKPFAYDADAHHALARRAAAESAVLLKNTRGLLPLAPGASVAVIGAFGETPRYQGAGSSKIRPNRLDTVPEELKRLGLAVTYAQGYSLRDGEADGRLTAEACEAARGKDAVVLLLGLPDSYEAEGFDRTSLAMPASHSALLRAVRAVNANTVAVLSTGAPVELAWEGDAEAILLSYLGGEAGAGGVADLLTGRANPCGKLAESWPMRLSDNPSCAYFPGCPRTVEYRESLFVGYRYYDTARLPVRYPFGHGLSYTSFAYEGLALEKTDMSDAETLRVACRVRNTGSVAGKEIVQLYVAPRLDAASGPFFAEQQLRGFETCLLAPGEEREIVFTLGKRDFAYFNTAVNDWRVAGGAYEIRLAASSRDIRLAATVHIHCLEETPAPDYRASAPCYYDLSKGLSVSASSFTALLGRPLPARAALPGEPFTLNSVLCEMRRKPIGRLFAAILTTAARARIGGNEDLKNMMRDSLQETPLRALSQMSGGAFTRTQAEGMVDMLNGRFFAGLRKMLRGR